MINISEIFGPTIQGEGPKTGHPTIFVRVYGCNLDCPWCDTKYAIAGGDNKKMTADEVVAQVKKLDVYTCEDITFTGGEPLLYIDELYEVIKRLYTYKFQFETNGTIFPSKYQGFFWEFNVDFVVSPKLHAIDEKYIEALKLWAVYGPTVCFKFVYESPETIKQIKQLKEKIPALNYGDVPIYLMPEGIKFDQKKYEETSNACIENGYILSSRLHNIIWGNKRGV